MTYHAPIVNLTRFLEQDSILIPDITFHLIGNDGISEALPAHKAFLSVFSEHFNSMFSGRFPDDSNMVVDNWEPQIFKTFINLIYGAQVLPWGAKYPEELKKLLQLLKLLGYHTSDGEQWGVNALRERILEVIRVANFKKSKLDTYIEMADDFKDSCPDAQKIIIDKIFEMKCLSQFSTEAFFKRLEAIVRDRNPRKRPHGPSLVTPEQRNELARCLPREISQLPEDLLQFHEPILRITRHILEAKAEHVTVDGLEETGTKVASAKDIEDKEKKQKMRETYLTNVSKNDDHFNNRFADLEDFLHPEPKSVLEGTSRTVTKRQKVTYGVPKSWGHDWILGLTLSVRPKAESTEETWLRVVELATKEFPNDKGVTYCKIEDISRFVDFLMKHGVSAVGLSPVNSGQAKEEWLRGKMQVLVTWLKCAGPTFDETGTGVQWVAHTRLPGLPMFIENLAAIGKRENKVHSILYWSLEEYFNESEELDDGALSTNELHGILAYCIDGSTCRLQQLAFVTVLPDFPYPDICGRCDNCKERVGLDVTAYAREALRVVQTAADLSPWFAGCGGGRMVRVTGKQVVEVLMGRGREALRRKDWVGGGLSREQAEAVVTKLLLDGWIFEDMERSPLSKGYRNKCHLRPADRQDPLPVIRMKFKTAIVEKEKRKKHVKSGDASNFSVENN